MQHERDPLRRRQGLEHHQHGNTNRVRDQFLGFRVIGGGHLFHIGVDRDFASRLSFAEHVEAHAGNDSREPPGEVVDTACTAPHEVDKGLLNRVLGLGL